MRGATALKQKLIVQLQWYIGRYVKVFQKEIHKAHDDCIVELKLMGSGTCFRSKA